jgi:hypothetical protein
MRGDSGVARWHFATPLYKKVPYIAAKRLFVFLICKGIRGRPWRLVSGLGWQRATPPPHNDPKLNDLKKTPK